MPRPCVAFPLFLAGMSVLVGCQSTVPNDPDIPAPPDYTTLPSRTVGDVPPQDLPPTDETLWPVDGWPRDLIELAANATGLNAVERDALLHINLVRTDPQRYAREFIAPRRAYYNAEGVYRDPSLPAEFAGYQLVEGLSAVDDCLRRLERARPCQPVTLYEELTLAAAAHAEDQRISGATGHLGSDGASLGIRLRRVGDWRGKLGEVSAYGFSSGRQFVTHFLIDDGVPDRSHRERLLDPSFRLVGIDFRAHPIYGSALVADFATAPAGRRRLRELRESGLNDELATRVDFFR